MADHPDVYADGITVTISPINVVISFTRTDPEVPGVSPAGKLVVARIRLHPVVAQGLVDVLRQAMAAQAKGKEETQTISH
jgi:hypothetical protein